MTSSTLRRAAAALTVTLATAATLGVGVPAHAAGAHGHARRAGSGTFTILIAGTNDSHTVGIAHGAITGGGKDATKGQTDVIQLGDGSITLDHPNKQSTFHAKVDPKTCYATFVLTGRFTLVNGTGPYAGVEGSGTYVGHGTGILARTSTGACDQKNEPRAEVFIVQATGHLS